VVTKPQRHWAALVVPTPGAELEEVGVDAATEREAREKAHAEAIALYGRKAKIAGIELRASGAGDSL
jgi:hypothetical protein